MNHTVPLPTPEQTPSAPPAPVRELPGMPPDDPIPPEMAPDEEMPTTPRPGSPRQGH